MSNQHGQRTRVRPAEPTQPETEGGDSGLSETRTQANRLYAVAARSFEAMRQGTSEEFLWRSRQTGGE